MKKIFLLVVLTLIPSILAQEPNVYVYPNYANVNTDMVIVVEPSIYDKPMRIVGCMIDGFGGPEYCFSFPIINRKGICYFSNEDENASCGPSPLVNIEGYPEIKVWVITKNDVYNTTKSISKGEIDGLEDRNLDIYINGSTVISYLYYNADTVSLKILDENMQNLYDFSMEKDPLYGRFYKEVVLNPGTYFLYFLVTQGQNHTGFIRRIHIGEEKFVSISINEAFIGDEIVINGNASNNVKGSLVFPNGSIASQFYAEIQNKNFEVKIRTNILWPAGTYKLKIDEPVLMEKTFNVRKLLEFSKSKIVGTYTNGIFNDSIEITNIAGETINLSFETSVNIDPSYIYLEKTELYENEKSMLSLSIPEDSEIDGYVIIKAKYSTGEIEYKIPVKVSKEQVCEEKIVEKVVYVISNIKVSKESIFEECVVGEEIEKEIDIENTGENDITINFEFNDALGTENSLEELYANGYIEIESEDIVSAGGSTTIKVKFVPQDTGRYAGFLQIGDKENHANIFVDINCHENLSHEISAIEDNLESIKDTIPAEIYNSIRQSIDDAIHFSEIRNYQNAFASYKQALAMLQIVNTVPFSTEKEESRDESTFPILLIVGIIIAIIGGIAIFFILKMRSSGETEKEFEEFEEI